MMKKAVVVGLIFAGLLIASAFSVHAADEQKVFNDDQNDVVGPTGENTSTKPNIDIVRIIYEKVGDEVTLTLNVKGSIQNKGDINTIYDEPISSPYVLYLLEFNTFGHTYDMYYVNRECNFTIDGEKGNIDFNSTAQTLTFTFNLKSGDETYGGLYVLTMDVVSTEDMYLDEFSDTPGELNASITAPSNGEVGKSISFSADVSGGTSYEYEWDFGDGNTSTDPTPTHTYAKEGTYNVALIVTDSSTGSSGSDDNTITITAGGAPSSSSSSVSGLIPFIVLIVVIVVAGVVVVVYFMRR